MRARPRRGATSPGPTRPASQPTTASSTTVTATAGPRSPRAKIASVSPTRTRAATSQPTPLVCSRYGSGGAAPVGRRWRGDRTASRRVGWIGGALVGVDRSAGRSMAPPNRGYLEPGRTTLFAEMWVVKAQNAARNQPPAGQRSRDRLSNQLRLRVKIGGRTSHDPRHRRQRHQEGNQLERSGCSQDTPLAARTPRQLRPSRRDSSCGPYWSPLLASLAKRPADTPRLPGHLHARSP
jgi:hypothetical protein